MGADAELDRLEQQAIAMGAAIGRSADFVKDLIKDMKLLSIADLDAAKATIKFLEAEERASKATSAYKVGLNKVIEALEKHDKITRTLIETQKDKINSIALNVQGTTKLNMVTRIATALAEEASFQSKEYTNTLINYQSVLSDTQKKIELQNNSINRAVDSLSRAEKATIAMTTALVDDAVANKMI